MAIDTVHNCQVTAQIVCHGKVRGEDSILLDNDDIAVQIRLSMRLKRRQQEYRQEHRQLHPKRN